MAPILKELEAPIANTTASGAPQSKPTNEPSARPQPVALEIPVTVNGARTVDGSDKRVPFSENTQTVLVLPHGAVIRIATPLASGQLVFLTNEKTKKEVVCQVVKSKASGPGGSYVELQFTEPSPGFWGLHLPSPPAGPVAPRPVVTAAPKAAAPPAAKPPVGANSSVPSVILAPPPRPVVPPPPASVVTPVPVDSHPESLASRSPSPPAPVVVSTPSVTAVPPMKSVAPAEVAPQAHAVTESPAAPAASASTVLIPTTPSSPTAVPALRDYSKQIEALFTASPAPVSPAIPETHLPPASTEASSEDLRQQATRLKAQLSSMLFTEAPPAAPTANSAPEPKAPAAKRVKHIVEIPKEAPAAVAAEPKTAEQIETKPVSAARKPASVALSADEEEVKIPSWLAPLSQNSDSAHAAHSSEKGEASADHAVSTDSEEFYDAPAASPRRPQTAVFGGQLLGEAAVPSDPGSAVSSKKGLLFGLAAAALLIAGGAWYFLQSHASPAPARTPPSAHSSSSTESAPASNIPPAPSTPAPNKGSSYPAASAQPPRNSVASSPAVSAPPTKNSKSTPRTEEPVEEPIKPTLGDVHLAVPVVNRSANSQLEGDSLQSIDTRSVPSGTNPFATTGSHHTPPTAPLPVGGDVKPAELLKSVQPEYPLIAKSQHIAGRVSIDALIDASGNVASVNVISGPPLLHRAAMDAVKQWKYKPAMLDGEPTTMHLTVTVEFRAQ
jgi:TonB family protein